MLPGGLTGGGWPLLVIVVRHSRTGGTETEARAREMRFGGGGSDGRSRVRRVEGRETERVEEGER